MLTIVCGEDQASSRNYYQRIRTSYETKGYETINIGKQDFEHISRIILEKPSLFASQQVYFTEYLVKYLKKNKTKSTLEEIDQLILNKSVTWIDWESYSGREITNPKKAEIKEFKLPLSIFAFLESIYPGNLTTVSRGLAKISETQEEGFIFSMFCRHFRQLILCTSAEGLSTLPAWQNRKLKMQSSLWKTDKLIGFYNGLARLDSSVKTSSNAFGILKSLEVLLLYFI